MADTVNLYAESGRNIIGDDSSATLRLENSSTGSPLHLLPAAQAANATGGAALKVNGQSVASGAVFAFLGDALVSAATIKFISGAVDGTYAIRVVTPKGTFGWIPVLPDTAVTLAAAS